MTDYVATRTGNRVSVKLSTGWTITYQDGTEHAQISGPGWAANDTRAITRPKPATVENLVAALAEGIRSMDPRPPEWARERPDGPPCGGIR